MMVLLVVGLVAWFVLLAFALAIASMSKGVQPRLQAPSNVKRIKEDTR